jgi:DNA invertase Pin-like site-specific DNA recombinase
MNAITDIASASRKAGALPITAKAKVYNYNKRVRASKRNDFTFDPDMERRAVIYCRISEDFNREDELSTGIQEDMCRRWATANNIAIVEVIIEKGESAFAGKSPRPKFKRALRMIESHAANVLMVYKLNRFMRDANMALKVRDDIHAMGGSVISCTEGLDTAAATGQMKLISDLTFMLLAQLAEQESVSKSEVMTDVHKATIYRNGKKALAPNGPAPYGYKKAIVDGERSLEIVKAEAKVILEWADRIIKGATLGDLRGTYNGRTFMNRGGIKHILTNSVTAGLRSSDGVNLVEGNWSPILNRETYDRLCLILNDPERFSGGVRGVRMHMLAGLITCAVHPDKKMRAINNTLTGPRYMCKCYNSMPVTQVDEMVKDFLFDLDDGAWDGVRSQGRAYDPEIIKDYESRLATLTTMYANPANRMSDAEYQSGRTAILDAMTKLESTEFVELPNIAGIKEGWDSLDVDGKRLVVSAFIESITIIQYKKDKSLSADDRLVIIKKEGI